MHDTSESLSLSEFKGGTVTFWRTFTPSKLEVTEPVAPDSEAVSHQGEAEVSMVKFVMSEFTCAAGSP